MKKATILFGPTAVGMTNFSSDLLWRTGFNSFDPFFFIEVDGETTAIVASLELRRAMKEEVADEVLSFGNLPRDGETDPLLVFLKKKRVTHVVIPSNFDYSLGALLKSKFVVEVVEEPFFSKRRRKTTRELFRIKQAQYAAECSVGKAIDFLKTCRIKGNRICDGLDVVTSEMMIQMIEDDLYRQGYLAVDTIFACGRHAADPHNNGSGPLKPHLPIVLDVFPFSLETHYYADMTRTIFIGEPSRAIRKMYKALLAVQQGCIKRIKAGVKAAAINTWATKTVESFGFDTEPHEGSGFIHGIGHGVGMEIHEPPSISKNSKDILKTGNVITVEPGLYYPHGFGDMPPCGMRIEDLVVVRNYGYDNLTKFSKDLDSIIVQ